VRILAVHNLYREPGGEDAVFRAETALLRVRGHEVAEYVEDNREIDRMRRLAVALRTVWSMRSSERFRRLLRDVRPHVTHAHNTLPLVSPSAYYACKAAGVPVVQTLHNYRLFCPAATFFRGGHVCEDCLGKTVPWPSVVHGCYRASRPASAVVSSMLVVHRMLTTWTRMVDLYIAPSRFARHKFVEGGLPADKIVVKPHFVHPDPGPGGGDGDYALFAGRLSAEKGVGTLLRAWERLGEQVPLRIVGDGPLAGEVARLVARLSRVEWLGHRPAHEVGELMGGARMLVLPSEWYEVLPRVVIEAFARGTPILAAKLGALAELVEDGRTGLHFRPGDPQDLAARADWLLTRSGELRRMRDEARAEYLEKYTAERNYELLMGIYAKAMGG
jgi:glycosyltransferase involved in cell wall biosynthesis